MQPFLRAAEGIRTLDLLHGKQLHSFPERPEIPANQGILPTGTTIAFQELPRICGYLDKEVAMKLALALSSRANARRREARLRDAL
ncbi:MAG TPA: hypothetical protein VK304_08670 [Thermoleophilaceae bacterium]|nr:hypothetical protein [Thermoleophilaceae bacterium]